MKGIIMRVSSMLGFGREASKQKAEAKEHIDEERRRTEEFREEIEAQIRRLKARAELRKHQSESQ